MSSAPARRREPVIFAWAGRVVACFFLILGSLVFFTFAETSSPASLALAITGVGGALLSIVGLERMGYPRSKWVQLGGWPMMAAFSLIPTSLLFIPSGRRAVRAAGAPPRVPELVGIAADRPRRLSFPSHLRRTQRCTNRRQSGSARGTGSLVPP